MPVKEAPYYWLECDGCGARCEYGEWSAMADKGSAIDGALDADWTTDGEKYNCDGCPMLTDCQRCAQPAGENADDRDGHCAACWALVDAGTAQ